MAEPIISEQETSKFIKNTEDDSIPSNSRETNRKRTIAIFLTAVALANLVPIWAATHFPAQNGPWFLLPTHMFKEMDNPQRDYSEHYQRNWHPIPHMLHSATILTLSYVFPLLTAEKIALSLYVLLLPLSIFYFAGTVAPEKKWLGCFSFLMVHTYCFYRGYHNFSLSIPLFFFTYSYWIRSRNQLSPRKIALLSVLAVLVFLSHLITFLLLVCVIGWYRLLETKNVFKAIASVLIVTWGGWILTLDYYLLNAQQSEWIDRSDTFWMPFHWTVQYFYERYFLTVSTPAAWIAGVVWTIVPVGIVASLCVLWKRDEKQSVNPHSFILGTTLLFVLLAFYALPSHFIGWHKVNYRFVPFVVGIAIAFLATLRMPEWLNNKSLLSSITGIASLAVVALCTRQVITMDRTVAEYKSGIEKFAENSRLLPIHYENEPFGWIRPITRAHEYYHIEKGGVNGYGIGTLNTLAMVWYRKYPVKDYFPVITENTSLEEQREIIRQYDFVLLWGKSEKREPLWNEEGFHLVHEQGKLRLYRNRSTANSDLSVLDKSGKHFTRDRHSDR